MRLLLLEELNASKMASGIMVHVSGTVTTLDGHKTTGTVGVVITPSLFVAAATTDLILLMPLLLSLPTAMEADKITRKSGRHIFKILVKEENFTIVSFLGSVE